MVFIIAAQAKTEIGTKKQDTAENNVKVALELGNMQRLEQF